MKKEIKKLTLKKETISILSKSEQAKLNGGSFMFCTATCGGGEEYEACTTVDFCSCDINQDVNV